MTRIEDDNLIITLEGRGSLEEQQAIAGSLITLLMMRDPSWGDAQCAEHHALELVRALITLNPNTEGISHTPFSQKFHQ